MSYCAICGKNHDTAVGCFEGADQTFKAIGRQKKVARKSAAESKEVVKQADRFVIKILLLLVGIFMLAIILSVVLNNC